MPDDFDAGDPDFEKDWLYAKQWCVEEKKT